MSSTQHMRRGRRGGVGDGGRARAGVRAAAAYRAGRGRRSAGRARLCCGPPHRQGCIVGEVPRPADPHARGRRVHGGHARVGRRGLGGQRVQARAAHRAAAGRRLGPVRVSAQHRAEDEPLLQPHRARRTGAARGGVGSGGGRRRRGGDGARGRRGHHGVQRALRARAARPAAAGARGALATPRPPRASTPAGRSRRRLPGYGAVVCASSVAHHAGRAERGGRGRVRVLLWRRVCCRASTPRSTRGTHGDATRRGWQHGGGGGGGGSRGLRRSDRRPAEVTAGDAGLPVTRLSSCDVWIREYTICCGVSVYDGMI